MLKRNYDTINIISKIWHNRIMLYYESLSRSKTFITLYKQKVMTNGSPASIYISQYLPTFYCRKVYFSLFIFSYLFAVLTFGLMGCSDHNPPTEPQNIQSIAQINGNNSSESRYLQSVLNANPEERNDMLRNGHRNFLNLPVEEQFVFSEVLPKIQENRVQLFPDFPERGGTPEETKGRIDDWLTNHPERLAAYLDFLDEQYKQFDHSFQQ